MLTPGLIVWYRPLVKDWIAIDVPNVGIVLQSEGDGTYRLAVFDRMGRTHSRGKVCHVEEMDGSMEMEFAGSEHSDWFSLPQKSFAPLNTEPVPDGTGLPAIGTV